MSLVCRRPAIQRGLPGRHVHNFRVRTATISDMNLLSLINDYANFCEQRRTIKAV